MEPTEANQELTEQQELEVEAVGLTGGLIPQPESQPEAPAESPEATDVPAETVEGQSAKPDPFSEIRESLKDTPFYQEGRDVKETVAEVKKAWKELQGWQSKTQEKVKPFEQLLDSLNRDSNLKSVVQRAVEMYNNPQLAQAYLNQQGQVVSGKPDIRNFDMNTYEGQQAYSDAVLAYTERAVDERMNTRMSGWEQQQRLEKSKLEFRQKFPDADVEKLLSDAPKLAEQNPLENAWKALNYDNLASQMYEKARKELSQKLEEASKTKTPAGASAPSKPVGIDEIVSFIGKYGPDAAVKRYTKAKVEEALRNSDF